MTRQITRLRRRDHELLVALREHAALGYAPLDVLHRLESKLSSVEVLEEHDAADDCVCIGSTIRCYIDERIVITLRLVLSPRLVQSPGDIPVTSALGIELLGRSEDEVRPLLAKHMLIQLDKPVPSPPEMGL